jgi:hypothetical protein
MSKSQSLKNYAEISNGKVINVSLWDDAPADNSMIEIPEGSHAGIDWDYIDGEFIDNRPKSEIPGI